MSQILFYMSIGDAWKVYAYSSL